MTDASTSPIRSTLLAGWLGAGKTTLLNELLANLSAGAESGSGRAERVAVIVNDIGDVNIDAALIERTDGDRIELSDGCICCSIGSSLALTLRDLVMVDAPPDHIVIEASGIAEPARVAAYGDRRRIATPRIVVAVDTTDVVERAVDPRFGSTVIAQITQADAVVLTKVDLVDSNRVERVRDWILDRVPSLPLIGRDEVWAPRDVHSIDRRTESTDSAQPTQDSEPINTATDSRVGVETITIDFEDDTVDLDELERRLLALDDLVRAKGIVRAERARTPSPPRGQVVVNVAAGRFEWRPHTVRGPESETAIVQHLVVILAAGSAHATGDVRSLLRAAVLD